jgi:hypothetical protein
MTKPGDWKSKIKVGVKTGSGAYSPRSFAILRCAKIKTMGNMGASLQHTFRERETPNADLKRLGSNQVLLGGKSSQDVIAAWRERAPEKIRTNAVHGLEYFVGSSPEAMAAKSEAEQDAYFQQALDWIKERHGVENVLSAVIHRDETTPHMTVMTIPLDKNGKLNARALVGSRQQLSAMQTDFADRVGAEHGLQRGLEGSKATHERVKSVYARITDPEAAVDLPARATGGFLGRGGESDEEWRLRASGAATNAVAGALAALYAERRNHEAEIGSLRNELAMGQIQIAAAFENSKRAITLELENRALAEQVKALDDEAEEFAAEMKSSQQFMFNSAASFVKAHGLDPNDLLAHINRDLAHEVSEEPKHTQSVRERDDGWGHD